MQKANEGVRIEDDFFVVGGTRDYGLHRKKMTCPNCRNYIQTKVTYSNTWKFYTYTGVLTFVGLCFIPIIFKWGKDGKHSCPVCNSFLGIATKNPDLLSRTRT